MRQLDSKYILYLGAIIETSTYLLDGDLEILKFIEVWSKSKFALEFPDATLNWPEI